MFFSTIAKAWRSFTHETWLTLVLQHVCTSGDVINQISSEKSIFLKVMFLADGDSTTGRGCSSVIQLLKILIWKKIHWYVCINKFVSDCMSLQWFYPKGGTKHNAAQCSRQTTNKKQENRKYKSSFSVLTLPTRRFCSWPLMPRIISLNYSPLINTHWHTKTVRGPQAGTCWLFPCQGVPALQLWSYFPSSRESLVLV